MKRIRLLTAATLLISGLVSHAQDFSNKGKDFWVGYGYHQVMNPDNLQQMVLYFATEEVTTVTVEIPRLGYVRTYANIPANTIFTSEPLPKGGPDDARLMAEGISNKGIHVTANKPIVAYTHIYNQSVSGAALLFPSNTLGREYYSVNYKQQSNTGGANCWFFAVAVDTGITTVEIIPSANTITHPAGVPFQVNLEQGQIINIMGTVSGTTGVDLTGSTIRSVSTAANPCKRIAVFSGSGRISLDCSSANTSSDNYIAQALPKNVWGKKYLTVPTVGRPGFGNPVPRNDVFRVCVQDPNTVVKLNGVPLTGLVNNFYYQLPETSIPNIIEGDKPIMVVQYTASSNACGNSGLGDPEVIYLSSVEQNINKVILNSTSNFAIQEHYINVVIKAGETGSFRMDGAPVSFQTHPRDPAFAFAQIATNAGQHILEATAGFNAIAYGWGMAESYGYNAGTNVRDLYQFVSMQNQLATVDYPAGCANAPFFLSMTFPYQPTQIKWLFGGLFTDITINNPVFDSTWIVNDRRLYRYKLPSTYTIATVGTYPIRVVASNPTGDGCNGEQEIAYNIEIFNRPQARFTYTTNGCVDKPVQFLDNSDAHGRPIIKWNWNFGDNSTADVEKPVHTFGNGGTYPVNLFVVTDIGCVSDTLPQNITLTELPQAGFKKDGPFCVNGHITFSDLSKPAPSGTIVRWHWDYGDGPIPPPATSNAPQTHAYKAAGSYLVRLKVESAGGCMSTAFEDSVHIKNNPVAAFSFGNACLPGGLMKFDNTSSLSDTGSLFYRWEFGDGSGTSTDIKPEYNYKRVGPFTVKLSVTSSAGCKTEVEQTVNTVFEQPKAIFAADQRVICLGAPVNFTEASTAPGSQVQTWKWTFGDASEFSGRTPPAKTYTTAGKYTVTLGVTSAAGCNSRDTSMEIEVLPLPDAKFKVSTPSCVTREIRLEDISRANTGSVNSWSWTLDGITYTTPAITHVFTRTGSFPVSLTVKNDRGCASKVPFDTTLFIHPVPDAGFIQPEACINDPFSLFLDTSTIADGTEDGFRFEWNFGDPLATPANNISFAKNGQHTYSRPDHYPVSLIVTSEQNCRDTARVVYTLNGGAPIAGLQMDRNLPEYCSNEMVSFFNRSSVDFGNITRLEVMWDIMDAGSKSNDEAPLPGKKYEFEYPVFYTPATKQVTLRIRAFSGESCYDEHTQTIALKATPDIEMAAIDPLCADAPAFQIRAHARNFPGEDGIFMGSGISATGLFDPRVVGAGNFPVTYRFTASNGCTNEAQQMVVVNPLPKADAGLPVRNVLEGGSVVLTGSGQGTGITYLWTPDVQISNNAIATPTVSPTDDRYYKLTVTTDAGCSASDSVFVKLLRKPAIPNVFSPNGDGIHDRWEISALDSYPGATVEIYNRYGQLVFRSKGYSRPWDGSFNGKPVPVGTYYYLINPKNGREQIAGFVDVIR